MISGRALARCPPVNKGQISPPFLLTFQICRRDVIFVVRRTTKKHSCILTGYVDALYALSFAVQTRKKPLFVLISLHMPFFPEWSLIPGPLCKRFSSKWMMELLLIRQISPWQKTVRTYCCRTPQKIRNCFSLSFLLF